MKEQTMFQAPQPTQIGDEKGYRVKLTNPVKLDCILRYDSKLIGEPTVLSLFETCRRTILQQIASTPSLFRTPPTVESLNMISPPWGFLVKNGTLEWSPYSQLTTAVGSYSGPVSISLTEVLLSRSCIRPVFWIERVETVIDIVWEGSSSEIEEVSDLPAVDGQVRLVDPAFREQEKRIEKERVRKMFEEAEAAARRWYKTYDISDDESTFSEWMNDEETE